ncbi:MAG: 3-deoxy-8-phosphooctulonate synthase [Nitrospirae bacterium]|nr:3-deoxy-8-phosphooctulonate synthase [Nitrospirota bacterium]
MAGAIHPVDIAGVTIGGGKLALIAGPCVIESEDGTLRAAERLAAIAARMSIPFIFKSSYDKANRTSVSSFRGPGIIRGLRILSKVKEMFGCPVLSDIHSAEEADPAAQVLDVIQIPAFLCRQTDILTIAARTGKPVNVKKGQFLSPNDAGNIVGKLRESGCSGITLTERGSSFGYNNLVVDMRSFEIMHGFDVPVIFDATHSVQLPGGLGGKSGGDRRFVPVLARAAVAAGCDALFMEVHEDPDKALCDGPNMINIDDLPDLWRKLVELREVVYEWK